MLLKDPRDREQVVPIIPDEARTFGMESLFRQLGIYSSRSHGQIYRPRYAKRFCITRKRKTARFWKKGSPKLARCLLHRRRTAYVNDREDMIPFFIYYSMFGFQRVGDLTGLRRYARRKVFCGGTAGRTTLAGEGWGHQDGNSP